MYPAAFQGKSRLTYYASLFSSVEINSSFYKLPRITTVKNWAESVPGGFQFTFKLSKDITHVKDLQFQPDAIDQFINTINHIGDLKGCLLIQFPPKLQIEKMQQVEKLLSHIRKSDPSNEWKIAVEFRHLSWYHEEVFSLLNKMKVALVFHDLPASATPLTALAGNFRYVRFHGYGANYRGSYPDDLLLQYARNFKEWVIEGNPVYFYFNNTMGDAVRNLQTLNELLKS
ncbi:MAG TPA: DUF72 domain-containing protein [Flavitalea sp.]|nr:DUF72 domain-containing protein [Flavitalea sp.]